MVSVSKENGVWYSRRKAEKDPERPIKTENEEGEEGDLKNRNSFDPKPLFSHTLHSDLRQTTHFSESKSATKYHSKTIVRDTIINT